MGRRIRTVRTAMCLSYAAIKCYRQAVSLHTTGTLHSCGCKVRGISANVSTSSMIAKHTTMCTCRRAILYAFAHSIANDEGLFGKKVQHLR